MIKLHVEFGMQDGSGQCKLRPPYSRETKLHGRKMKSDVFDVACRKLGLQTEDYIWYRSIQEKSIIKCKLNEI